MKNALFRSTVLAALFVVVPIGSTLAQAPQPDKTTATYGAWTLTCTFKSAKQVQQGAGVKKVEGADDKVQICEVAQTYGSGAAGQQAMLAIAPSPKDPKKTLAALRVPVDVFLLFNPSISVDDQEIAKGKFVRCAGRSCSANFVLDEAALNKFAESKKGSIVFKAARGQLTSIPVRGNGLKTALAAFKAQQK